MAPRELGTEASPFLDPLRPSESFSTTTAPQSQVTDPHLPASTAPAPQWPRPGTTAPPALSGVRAAGRGTARGDVAITVAGVGLGICVGMGVMAVRPGLHLPGGWAIAVGTVTAMAGTYLVLVLLLLISRLPWLEREVGHDRMLALHRKVAPYSLGLIAAHAVFTTVGYAQASQQSVLGQAWSLITQSAWMLPATTAFVLMMSLGVLSYRRIRERMTYETWWVAHLYFYIAVALGFGHQIELGAPFLANPIQRWFWISLYVFVATAIVISRVISPLVFSARHQLEVTSVVRESADTVSIYLSGKDLDLIAARGGQFFQWRFLTRHRWWQSHPYSLSAAPNSSWLRITVKALGDHSLQLAEIHPGTRVIAEGPYGVFTAAARHGHRVVAFAAGVGVTPVRAMLDDLPRDSSVDVIYRASSVESAPLLAELEHYAKAMDLRLHVLTGPRHAHPLGAADLLRMIPDLVEADVFVCGPATFTDSVVASCQAVGVPSRKLHHESFSF